MQALKREGIGWRLVAVFRGQRSAERQMKNQRNARRYCPECRPALDDLKMRAYPVTVRWMAHGEANTDGAAFSLQRMGRDELTPFVRRWIEGVPSRAPRRIVEP